MSFLNWIICDHKNAKKWVKYSPPAGALKVCVFLLFPWRESRTSGSFRANKFLIDYRHNRMHVLEMKEWPEESDPMHTQPKFRTTSACTLSLHCSPRFISHSPPQSLTSIAYDLPVKSLPVARNNSHDNAVHTSSQISIPVRLHWRRPFRGRGGWRQFWWRWLQPKGGHSKEKQCSILPR